MNRFTGLATLLALISACSGTTDGSNGNGSGANGNGGCVGAFCLENDLKLSADPKPLVYLDSLPTAAPQVIELKITHIGNLGTLQLTGMTFEPPTDEFTVTDFEPRALESLKQTAYHVQYAPKFSGAKALTLVIATNATAAAYKNYKVPVIVNDSGNGLIISPNPIDFGNVASGQSVDQEVTVTNKGNKSIKIMLTKLDGAGSDDFTIAKPPGPDAIGPGASTLLTLRYKPLLGDHDDSKLQINGDDNRKVMAMVTGNEIAPNITAVPPKLDFGDLPVAQPGSQKLRLINNGVAPLNIASMDGVFDKSAAGLVKSVSVTPAAPLTIEGGKDLIVTVQMTAAKPLPTNGSPAASLAITSNAANTPSLFIALFGTTDAPNLKVTPFDVLEFGIVGKSKPPAAPLVVTRKVELFNEGTAPLDITSVSVTDDKDTEFAADPLAFSPAGVPPAPYTLAPAAYATFNVTFVNKGPIGQDAKANLHIKSTDPNKLDVVVKLLASRADGTKCNIIIKPSPLNFGVLSYGLSKKLSLTLRNTGTGNCSYVGSNVMSCFTAGMPPLVPPSSACKNANSQNYKTFAPAAKLFNLGPSEEAPLQIEFDAPEDLGAFGGGKANTLTEVNGLIITQFKDISSGSTDKYPNLDPLNLPPGQKPNLLGKVGKADVAVLPGDIDAGILTVGCKSPIATVSVYNNGTTDAFINKIEFVGCGPEVTALNWPAIPKTGLQISQSKPSKFDLKYGPQNVGKDACQLNVYTSLSAACVDASGLQTGAQCIVNGDCAAGQWCMGQLFTVPITGEGTLDTEYTDIYDSDDGKKVDVLFIVDDSGSMGNKQDNLSQNFTTFVQIATLFSGTDYHIGVVTTDMDDGNKTGKLQETGGVRIVTKKDASPTKELEALAKPGANGSGNEQGLIAGLTATTPPLTFDSLTKTCKGNADCAGSECVKGAEDGKLMCGGHNRTFIRKFAALEVVILSDEEDSSPQDPNYYLNSFMQIHGVNNKNLFHFHAIVGDKGGCKSNGGADAGNRYIELANKTGGKFASICSGSYAQALQDIGTAAFGLTQQYFLTRTPEPATVTVKVGGKPCPAGAASWSYDPLTNSVTFADKSTCMPQKGDKVEIHYKMLCFP